MSTSFKDSEDVLLDAEAVLASMGIGSSAMRSTLVAERKKRDLLRQRLHDLTMKQEQEELGDKNIIAMEEPGSTPVMSPEAWEVRTLEKVEKVLMERLESSPQGSHIEASVEKDLTAVRSEISRLKLSPPDERVSRKLFDESPAIFSESPLTMAVSPITPIAETSVAQDATSALTPLPVVLEEKAAAAQREESDEAEEVEEDIMSEIHDKIMEEDLKVQNMIEDKVKAEEMKLKNGSAKTFEEINRIFEAAKADNAMKMKKVNDTYTARRPASNLIAPNRVENLQIEEKKEAEGPTFIDTAAWSPKQESWEVQVPPSNP